MTDWTKIDQRFAKPFTIITDVRPEWEDADWCFDDAEVAKAIKDGKWEWFQVRVCAYADGVKLATEYLGACAYQTYRDFLECEYHQDMVNEAIDNAVRQLRTLTQIYEGIGQ